MKKLIFVVGAGKGLGNGVAEKFAQENFQVVLISRSEKNLAAYKKDFAEKIFPSKLKRQTLRTLKTSRKLLKILWKNLVRLMYFFTTSG